MRLADEHASRALGAALAGQLRRGDVITLSGPLGAGKTSIARGLIEALGHAGDIPSPSFAIVQPYDELALPLWHVDLYRIDDPGELVELGLECALDDGAMLVEWPEHGGHGRWPQALALSLVVDDAGGRRLTAVVPPGWEGRWPPR